MIHHTRKRHLWAVWHNGSALFSINVHVHVVTLRWARLVLGWVTIGGFKFYYTILVFNQIPRPNQPGIPPWVGKRSID